MWFLQCKVIPEWPETWWHVWSTRALEHDWSALYYGSPYQHNNPQGEATSQQNLELPLSRAKLCQGLVVHGFGGMCVEKKQKATQCPHSLSCAEHCFGALEVLSHRLKPSIHHSIHPSQKKWGRFSLLCGIFQTNLEIKVQSHLHGLKDHMELFIEARVCCSILGHTFSLPILALWFSVLCSVAWWPPPLIKLCDSSGMFLIYA